MNKYITLRGGGWFSTPDVLSSACRDNSFDRSDALDLVGFRLVLKKVETDRPLRGGSWGNGVTDCRAAVRFGLHPVNRGWFVGFRLTLRRTNE